MSIAQGFGRTILLSASLVAGMSCASKLKHNLTNHAPAGMQLEESLDTSAVSFTVAETGESVNLREYMDSENRDYILLTFGSKGCAACNRKAEHLKNDIIGRHPLFLTPEGSRFEIVGVNTDKEPHERMAGYLALYPFIKWSDPAGRTMLDVFMPPGNKFSVPLTVMVSKTGIAWRVLPHDSTSLSEMIGKVEVTLGLRDQAPGPTDDGGGEGDGGTSDGGADGSTDGAGEGGGDDGAGIPAIDLASQGAGRLKGVNAKTCDGHAITLDAALGAADFRFVQIARDNCGATCQANLAELKGLAQGCAAGHGKTCAVASLQGGALLAAECGTGIAVQGGAEFFDVFKSFLNWTYTPLEGPPPTYALTMPAVEGPVVLGFSAKGELVYSKEGALAVGELKAELAKPGFGALARGPDFKLFDEARGEFGFSALRLASRFTVVSAWGAYPVACGSCIDELKEWSKPDALYDFCHARPTDCQVVALESHLPEVPEQSISQFYDGIVHGDGQGFDGFEALGIRVPLILDPLPINGPTGKEYLQRFFDGYMTAMVPEYHSEYRTFIYDQEGKIVATFKSAEVTGADPVLTKLKVLLKD